VAPEARHEHGHGGIFSRRRGHPGTGGCVSPVSWGPGAVDPGGDDRWGERRANSGERTTMTRRTVIGGAAALAAAGFEAVPAYAGHGDTTARLTGMGPPPPP